MHVEKRLHYAVSEGPTWAHLRKRPSYRPGLDLMSNQVSPGFIDAWTFCSFNEAPA